MKRTLTSLLLAITVVTAGSNSLFAQSNKAAREALDDRTEQVNKAAKKQGKDVALRRIATETGVPLEQVQSLNKKYDNIGPAGLMVACVLANDTKKDPEHFLKQRKDGKSWAAMARDNNVPLERVNSRLDRLEGAIGHDVPDKSEKHNKAK